MKKILSSVMMLALVALFAGAGTMAYFSDTETTTDNTFVAGTVNLEVANAGYYNGVLQDGSGLTEDTTWPLSDLTDELFFNFDDVKPGDWGENTTTLQANTNPYYACMNVTLTSSAENGVGEPEDEDGDTADNGNWNGELDDEIHFIAWADDGDNVLEDNETLVLDRHLDMFPQGALNTGETLGLADGDSNIFGVDGDPLTPGVDYNLGHGWCFGDLTLAPVAAGSGVNPTVDPGFTCDGSLVTNVSQSDDVVGNISFYAVQERNNTTFDCETEWNPNP